MRTLVAERDWFQPWSQSVSHTFDAPPTPTLMDVVTDGRGRLWVLTTIAAKNWVAALDEGKDIMDNQLLRPGAHYRDTVLEVFDLKHGRVIARRVLPRGWSGFADVGWLWRTWVDEAGLPQVDVTRVELVGG